MHITLIAVGSRGDVQPCIALGVGLQRARYSVRVATHRIFQDMVARFGLDYLPIEGNPQEIMQGDSGQDWLESGSNPLTMMRRMREVAAPSMRQLAVDYMQACQNTDAVLFSTLVTYAAAALTEKFDIPLIGAFPTPLHPTSAFPAVMSPTLPDWMPLRGAYNALTHDMTLRMMWWIFKDSVNEQRQMVMDLPATNRPFRETVQDTNPTLYGYSPHVVSRPPEWGQHIQITGYWFLDEPDWTAPADLLDFLNAGKPPVYIGFGSMTNRDPQAAAESVLAALKRSGQRGVISTGWGGISQRDMPEDVFLLDTAPHGWLFPRMAAVVHHGGAGTTSAGLRAGVPSILVPHFADQFFWGDRVAALGVGPQPIPRKKLNADTLAAAITQAVSSVDMQRRATALGEKIRAEDGVGEVVRRVGEIVGVTA